MTADPRPGFEERERPHRRWLTRGDVVFGAVVGLLLAAGLVAVMPDVRTHLFGGTDRQVTTVIGVREGTRSGDSDRPLTTYVVRWEDGDDVRSATYRRSGPPRREVGETWALWVAPDGSTVEAESPLVTWLWLGLGLPVASLVLGLLWEWRQRVFARMILRDVERHAARRARRAQGT
jgi:heme exporter protein D